ncbi:MAG: hypothetical protein E7276_04735 [Pseudobutyrivibrio sp.]|nr:hypothetical protein [Pseudobutyrivibrio sp.]
MYLVGTRSICCSWCHTRIS